MSSSICENKPDSIEKQLIYHNQLFLYTSDVLDRIRNGCDPVYNSQHYATVLCVNYTHSLMVSRLLRERMLRRVRSQSRVEEAANILCHIKRNGKVC
jgi:hypothetical protein